MKKADDLVLDYLKRAEKLLLENYNEHNVIGGIKIVGYNEGKPIWKAKFNYVIKIAKMLLELEKLHQVIWEK